MSSMPESKVTQIIKSLNVLEDSLDSLNSKVSDMKKQFSIKTQTEIDTLLESTQGIATKEAETFINTARTRVTAESEKIIEQGDAKLSEIQSNIDANFDQAVQHVVSTILKA